MSVVDKLENQVEQFRSQPSPAVEERAAGEQGAILESGRTVGDVLELLVELRDVTVSLWENDQFARFPNGLTKNLNNQIQQVLNACSHYGQNQNQAADLETRVDQLHAFLWQNNLLDRPEELPGYERKVERLESLRRRGREILDELESGLAEREELAALREEADNLKDHIGEVAEWASSTKDELGEQETNAQQRVQEIQEHASEAERVENSAQETLTRAKDSADEISAREKEIRAFFEEIESAQADLDQIKEEARSTVDENSEETRELIERNRELTERVKDQLQRATGASLFKEFDRRKEALEKSKWVWAAVSVLSLVGSVIWGVYLAGSAGDPDTIFFVKLGATVPLLAVVVFSLTQYGRERRAEAAYAFKSALSLSLVPYKELVEELETGDQDPEYAKFLTRTINQIYEAPEVVSKPTKENDDLISLGAVQKLTRIMERLVNR